MHFAPVVPFVSLLLVATGPAPAGAAERAPDADRLTGVTVTAHRGGAAEVPENSMQGLAATHRRGYARVLDADVRRLRDGTLVAMHDATLDRTTDHRGRVGALDWAAWQRVRLTPSPGLPGRWRPERPPSVREILDRFGGRSLLMLELKDPAGLPRLARLIRNRQLSRSVLVESNDPRVAERAHGLGLLTAVWRSAAQLAHDRPARWQRYVTMLSVDHRTKARHVRRAVGRASPTCGRTPSTAGRPATGCSASAARASSRTNRAAWPSPAAAVSDRGRDAATAVVSRHVRLSREPSAE
ncbi:glycerophosphodiester phosphodiesterase [Streptomyces albus]